MRFYIVFLNGCVFLIIVTNDDGIYSKGIKTLYGAAVEVFGEENVAVVAPSGPRSASGMSLTFHKPLRIEKVIMPGIKGFSVSGTPADCVFISIYHIFKNKKIELVLSGVNNGSNASLQAVESSGTVSAVKFGAVHGIKGIAFSLATEMGLQRRTFSNVKMHIIKILNSIKEKGFPSDVDMLNINFPTTLNSSTKIKICDLEDALFDNFVNERTDPSNKLYYWLGGTLKKRFKKGSDCYELFIKKSIAVSPMELASINPDLKKEIAQVLDASIA